MSRQATRQLAQRVRRLELEQAGIDPNTPEAQAWIQGEKRRVGNLPKLSAIPTSVYRCYDEEGRLLYVGITSRTVSRANTHASTKPWWTEMVRQEWEHFPTRAEALSRERELIETLDPMFNVVRPKRFRT